MTDRPGSDTASLEYLIDTYILDQRLGGGSNLPHPHELAAQLMCDETSLIKALHSAETKQKLAYREGVWIVLSPETVHDHSFSFTKSAHGRDLTTEVIEVTVRPPVADKDDAFYLAEQRAQEALGLPKHVSLLVIERLRLLDGKPGAFQRAYLSPTRFPADFVERHNFKTESLIDIYRGYGYKLLSRDTVLAARFANPYEINTFNRYSPSLDTRAVLDVEQRLYAEEQKERPPFVLEFLKASYLENWRYEIKNRPPSLTT